MARLVGINVDRVISSTFIIGSVLAAIGGVAIASRTGQINTAIGFMAGLKAFTRGGARRYRQHSRRGARWSWSSASRKPSVPATFRAPTRTSSLSACSS